MGSFTSGEVGGVKAQAQVLTAQFDEAVDYVRAL